jgi:hypothetical protein
LRERLPQVLCNVQWSAHKLAGRSQLRDTHFRS